MVLGDGTSRRGSCYQHRACVGRDQSSRFVDDGMYLLSGSRAECLSGFTERYETIMSELLHDVRTAAEWASAVDSDLQFDCAT